MLTIYHVPGTRSVRPIWLCYELDLPVEIKLIDFSPSYRNSAEWRGISAAGKVPAITDDDLNLFESGAIVDYILERYGRGRLQPEPGTTASAEYRQWSWFSEATLSRPVGLNRLLKHTSAKTSISDEATNKARNSLDAVNQALSERPFILGDDFSAADIMMGYTLHLLAQLDVLDETYENAHPYLIRLKHRDPFTRALAV